MKTESPCGRDKVALLADPLILKNAATCSAESVAAIRLITAHITLDIYGIARESIIDHIAVMKVCLQAILFDRYNSLINMQHYRKTTEQSPNLFTHLDIQSTAPGR